MYDFQVTARAFLRDEGGLSCWDNDERQYQYKYTVAVFGWAAEMTPSAGRIYRFSNEHLHGPTIAEKMNVSTRVADAIVTIMQSFDQPGVTCAAIDARNAVGGA